MVFKRLVLVAASIVALLGCFGAQATSHELSIRQTDDGTYEAVVTYDPSPCNAKVFPPYEVRTIGSEIQISSPFDGSRPCRQPRPSGIAEVKTSIGQLNPGAYSVTWSQFPTFELAAQLVVPGSPVEIPALSLTGVLILALIVFVGLRLTMR